MKVIIAGSRKVTNRDKVFETINAVVRDEGLEITEVVSGTASGPDTFGAHWALERKIKVTGFRPKWAELGKGAGFIRNEQMAKYADALIAVWDGESKGTKHMIAEAKKKGLKVFVRRV